MKFKYLLRGLGIGVVITASIMGAYTRSAVADARVAVMKQYGFGEEPTLVGDEEETESAEEESTAQTEETIPIIVRDEAIESEVESVIESAKASEKETQASVESVSESEPESKSESESNSESESKSKSESKSEPTSESKSESTSESNSKTEGSSLEVPDYIDAKDVVELPETIDITVAGGDDSGKVSRKLYNAGIIDNASEFDAFLMQHGYDKKITVGTKTINITDTWQEIAEKLTHK